MSKTVLGIGAAMALALANLASGPAYAADAANGAKVFKKCAICHVADAPKNKVGPHLVNVIGRTPGGLEGFKYSKAMKAFGESNVWDETTLAAYLAKPRAAIKGTRMAFPGLKKEEQIADVIAYMKQFSE